MGRPHLRLTRQETEIALGQDRHVTLGEEVGTGSTATVYRAVLKLGWGIQRPIAVKVFDPVSTDDRESVLATMAAAARGAASVRHPNVAQVLEFGVLEGLRPFVFQELITGPSLEAFTAAYDARKLRVPLDLALFLGVEIAEALDGARTCVGIDGARVGLVHGDISAREVIVSSLGEVKVTDFGLAAATRAASSVRSFSSVAKRAATVAPEVIGGEEPGPRSDVFSLGVVLWQMLVGPRFPRGLTDAETLIHARDGYLHTSVFDPQLPAALKGVLHRALDPNPLKRYPHAGGLAFELRRVALSMGVGDGRVFLKYAVTRMREDHAGDDPTTAELLAHRQPSLPALASPAPPARPPLPTPAGARPRPSIAALHPVSGTVRKAPPRPNSSD